MINYLKQLKNILQSNIFFIICIIITCLYTFINIKLINYKSVYKGNECEFIGQITKIKKNNYGYSIILNSKEKLILYTNKFNYNLGDVVLVKGNLEKAKNNTVFNNFNYKKYLYQNKIFYILKADDIKLLKKILI